VPQLFTPRVPGLCQLTPEWRGVSHNSLLRTLVTQSTAGAVAFVLTVPPTYPAARLGRYLSVTFFVAVPLLFDRTVTVVGAGLTVS